MVKKLILSICVIFMAVSIYSIAVYAQDAKPVKLLAPDMKGGRSLMDALKDRKTQRDFSTRELPLQVLSDLLWAADGINRPLSGGRTAPTAMDMQEIDIYVARSDGLYLFDAKNNILAPVLSADIREATGKQPFVKDAPINLIYVADLSKMKKTTPENIDFYSGTDTGFVSQNVYLYCASAGLATVVRGWVDKSNLAKVMKLRDDQKVILAQTVGYPKE